MKKLIITREQLIQDKISFPLTDFTNKERIESLINLRLKNAGFSLLKNTRRYTDPNTDSMIFEQDE